MNLRKPEGSCNRYQEGEEWVYREGKRGYKKEGEAASQHRSQATDTKKARNECTERGEGAITGGRSCPPTQKPSHRYQEGEEWVETADSYKCCSCSICSPITTYLLTPEQQMSFWLKEDIKILRILNHLPERCVLFQHGDYHPRMHSSPAKPEGAGVPQPVCFRSTNVCQLTQLPMYLLVGNQNNSSSMHPSPQPCIPGINE